MFRALARHWPEYTIEAAGLGLFMVAAGGIGTVLEALASPVRQAIGDPLARRFLMGLAMGLTAVALVYSPWGKRSGAHLNPAVTLTFLRLGKIQAGDAFFYMLFQFVGGVAGLAVISWALGAALADPPVTYVVTRPSNLGPAVAFAAEALMAFVLMLVVLMLSNTPRLNRFTGLAVGVLLTVYITVEAPYSGMSLNPARSAASAVLARVWQDIWIYFTAVPIGMLAAAEIYRSTRGPGSVLCAKLHHDNHERCIFRCAYPRRLDP